ncbi:DUF365 domain-containing protein [Candidatus Bathyarchaeota archaeon]|nr:DUF365 domain-containing protein [Candidatus Bathyarchaeota archaeon]
MRLVELSEIIGVVYPIPINLIGRLLMSEKDVFVKYLPHTTNVNLKLGSKLLFYASRASREIVGESIVKSVEFLTPDDALSKYGDRLMLSREELAEYTSGRPTRTSAKKMLVLTLSKVRRYSRPVKYPRPLTMTGEYLTRKKYKSLMKAKLSKC